MIDDDPDVRDLVVEYLGKNEMRVTAGRSGREMFELFDREAIDLVLLDLKMPGEDGLQLARALRERATVAIVLLTGRNEEADRVMGLELGADDYITKPFSPRELLARVRAVLRRYQLQTTLPERDNQRRAFRFAGWELNLRTRRLLSPSGAPVELSNGEFSLLDALCRAPQRVLSRDQCCRCRGCTRLRCTTGRGRADPPSAPAHGGRPCAADADRHRARCRLPLAADVETLF
ncbi:response regulator transcription factor [Roseateles sp. GG27B]